MPIAYDPAWAKALEPLLPLLTSRPVPKVGDIELRRENAAVVFGAFGENISIPEGLVQEEFDLPSYDGANISVLYSHLTSTNTSEPTAAIVHAHGGGFILGSTKMMARLIGSVAAQHGLPTFSVNYRKAPEHPHPTPTEDVYAALVYLQTHAARFNINPSRIAIFGESAGGGIAAGVALMARDRHLTPPLAKQVLVYPMLDDRNMTPIPGIEPLATWNCAGNITGWTALLGADKAGKPDADVSPYAAPARAASLAGLPRTYIDVGDVDIFKAENIEYVSRLCREDVSVEFHLYPGVPHAFEGLAPELWVTEVARKNRVRALMDF